MGRSKDAFIEKTGGFRFGESEADFRTRVTEIERLEQSLVSGGHDMDGIESIMRKICTLKGIDFDSYDDPND